jgi:hypothetical protein
MKQILSYICSFFFSLAMVGQIGPWGWVKYSTGPKDEVGNAVACDNSGNVYVTGYYSGAATFGTINIVNSGFNDVFIVKYNSAGNVVWAKGIGGSGYEMTYDINVDAAGNVYIAGTYGSSALTFGSHTINNSGASGTFDGFIAKYDGSGNCIWVKNYGGANDDAVASVCTDASGNIFITGGFASSTLTAGTMSISNTFYNSVCLDIFVAKLTSAGNPVWLHGAGGNGNNFDEGTTVRCDATGNVFLGGYFKGTSISFGSVVLTGSVSSQESFVVKYDNNGNPLWGASTKGAYGAPGRLAIDNSNNIILSGAFTKSVVVVGTATVANPTYSVPIYNPDIFIAKFSNAGNLLWAKGAGSPTPDEPFAAASDASGYIYIGGYGMGGSLQSGTVSTNFGTTGTACMLVLKFDANGNTVAALTNTSSVINAITLNNSNRLVLLGNYAGSVVFGS